MSRHVVVVPCFNESRRLPVDVLRDWSARHAQWRFLFVDDGSRDDTWAVLQTFVEADPESFAAIRLPANRGKAEAIRQGVLFATAWKPRYVGYWDADLATPLEELERFRQVLDEHGDVDFVLGARVRLLGRAIERRLARHLLGRLFATLASLLLRLPVYDTQCGAKMLRVTPTTAALFAAPFRTSWVFDVELLARFLQTSGDGSVSAAARRLYELPLQSWADVAGSKLRFRHCARALWDLGVIWRADHRMRGLVAKPIEPLVAGRTSPPAADESVRQPAVSEL